MSRSRASEVASMKEHPFDRAGLASLDDLERPEWRSLFNELETHQRKFLDKESAFRTGEYHRSLDTLHTCIRVWEYPFVYHHLRKYRESLVREINPTVVDLGSGVTFFPFAVANLGYEVIALDKDPICEPNYRRALAALPLEAGSISFKCADATSIPLPESSVDCVYCISVLEHIPGAVSVVHETARILRPGGLFIVTFDIDLAGTWSIGPGMYEALRDALLRKFDFVFPELTVHPMRLLTSDNSPYPYYPKKCALCRGYRFLRSRASAIKALLRRRGADSGSGRILASTYGTCLKKKAAGPDDD